MPWYYSCLQIRKPRHKQMKTCPRPQLVLDRSRNQNSGCLALGWDFSNEPTWGIGWFLVGRKRGWKELWFFCKKTKNNLFSLWNRYWGAGYKFSYILVAALSPGKSPVEEIHSQTMTPEACNCLLPSHWEEGWGGDYIQTKLFEYNCAVLRLSVWGTAGLWSPSSFVFEMNWIAFN